MPQGSLLKYFSHMSHLILIMVKFYMIRVIIILFTRKWSQFKKQHYLYQGTIRGSSRENLYQELGLESLQQWRWYEKLCCFLKIAKTDLPSIYSIISPSSDIHTEQETIGNILQFNVKHIYFFQKFILLIHCN